MKQSTCMFVLLLSVVATGCSTVTPDVSPDVDVSTPAPMVEPAPAPVGEVVPVVAAEPLVVDDEPSGDPVENPTEELTIENGTMLAAERYTGDLVLDRKKLSVSGAGVGKTVIDGDLIVGTQCVVTGLTVTGDVIFKGNAARVVVECQGQVLDYGNYNVH